MDGISGGGRGKECGEVGKFLAFWRVWYTPDRTTTVQGRASEGEGESDASSAIRSGDRRVPAVGLLCG